MAAPPVLLPYQQRWLTDTSPVRIVEKSRRVGLSWAMAAEAALTAAQAGPRGMDTWYVGYNKDMAIEFIRDVADWARDYQIAAAAMEEIVVEDEDEDIIAFRVTFASGYRVTALSSRPSNLRGKAGVVVIDEAAFHPELSELLKAALALLMWGGRVCVISTHNGAENPFNELIGEVRSGARPYALHRITFNDALADGLYRRICLRTGAAWSAEGERAWAQGIRDFYGEAASEELDCIPKGQYCVGKRNAARSGIVDAPQAGRIEDAASEDGPGWGPEASRRRESGSTHAPCFA